MNVSGAADFIARFNAADWCVIAILALCAWRGAQKGLVRMTFGLFGVFIAIAVANAAHPAISAMLRSTVLFDYIKAVICAALGLDALLAGQTPLPEQTLAAQTRFINELPIPDYITNHVLTNNNDEIFRLFDVTRLEDYIASYIANMFLNAIAVMAVFVITIIVMKVISRGLNLFTKLPVINHFNRLGGMAAGVVLGVVLIWFLTAAITLFFMQPPFGELIKSIPDSQIAKYFYERNVILRMIARL